MFLFILGDNKSENKGSKFFLRDLIKITNLIFDVAGCEI